MAKVYRHPSMELFTCQKLLLSHHNSFTSPLPYLSSDSKKSVPTVPYSHNRTLLQRRATLTANHIFVISNTHDHQYGCENTTSNMNILPVNSAVQGK